MYQGLSSLQAGMLSSTLEHTVPEQMFSTATQKAQAVSTVKLLNLAAQQGIAILHITPANSAITIPSLQLAPEVIAEIQTAVAVGKEVIVHQNNITAFGWTGAGYVVLDPITGDAAWRISGGGNGGIAVAFGYISGLIVGVMSIILSNRDKFANNVGAAIIVSSIAALVLTIGFYLIYVGTRLYDRNSLSSATDCFLTGFSLGMTLMAFYGANKYLKLTIQRVFALAGISLYAYKQSRTEGLNKCMNIY